MRDAADLDAGAVVFERLFQPAFNGTVVAALVHIDEVDDDKAGKIAKTQLARDFFRRFAVCLERRVLNVVLSCGTSGVDVDGHERFGLIDHDVAA
jgi:hypothetical protein